MSPLLTLRYRCSSSRLLSTRLSSLSFSKAGCLYSSGVKIIFLYHRPSPYHQPIPILMRACISVLCSEMRNWRSASRPKMTGAEKKTTHIPILTSLALFTGPSCPQPRVSGCIVYFYRICIHICVLKVYHLFRLRGSRRSKGTERDVQRSEKRTLSLCKMLSGMK